MQSIRLSKDIIPINRLKNQASSIINDMRKYSRPVVITQNGRPAAVVITPEEYDSLTENKKFLDSVNRGLADIKDERYISDEHFMKEAEKWFRDTE